MVNAKLVPNQLVYVMGVTTDFSSLGQIVSGERLKQMNQFSNYPVKENTNITIKNPRIISTAKEMTSSEMWVKNHFYVSKKNNDEEYRALSKVYNPDKYRLPWIAVSKPKSHVAHQFFLKKGEELAKGQQVVLVMRTFKGNPNAGISLSGVVVFTNNTNAQGEVEPIVRSFGSQGMIKQALRGIDITLEGSVDQPTDVAPATIDDSQFPASMTQTQTAKPANNVAPVANTNPVASKPATPAPAPQQTQAPVSANQSPWDEDAYANMGNEEAFDVPMEDQPVDNGPLNDTGDVPDMNAARAHFDSEM